MGFRTERPKRYAGGYKTLADIRDRFDFLNRHGVVLRVELHQVAQADRRRLAHRLGILLVGRV